MTVIRPFRFGVVATPDGSWTATARRVEELGYSSLLMPDGIHLLAPFPSLATAAAVTTTLRVGTFVLASPLRTPGAAAWEAHSLSVLSGGRFDLGIGTGHGGVPHAAAQLGMPYGSAAERRQQVVDTVARVRELDASIPVLIAASGPKMLALAAELADVVTLATDPLATRAEVSALAAGLPERVEVAMNLFVVGDEVPQEIRRFVGADAATLIAADSLVMLRGSATEMADELQRRRDAFGTSAITVNGAFLEQFAPVIGLLDGK